MERPFLSAALPGCGGSIKRAPEDFRVEELPAYAPSGEGEHLFLFVEKEGHDTPWVAKALARAARLAEDEVAYAGLKDRQAVTRQLFSVPARAEAALEGFAARGARILWRARHRNKLRPGHLRGNRFRVRIRGARDPAAAEAVFALLCAQGTPNYYGTQRFGRDGENAAFGKRIVFGQRLARAPTRFERRLFLSAYQSELFNRLLGARVAAGELGSALAGDVLRREDSGGLFHCEAPAIDQPRVERFEVSPAGPLFGPKLFGAKGEVEERESALLREEGLTLEQFRRGKGLGEGARRAYRVRPTHPELAREGDDVLLAFDLPAGSYATAVLDEVMKPA